VDARRRGRFLGRVQAVGHNGSEHAREVRAQNDRGTVITQTGPVVEFTYASGRASLVFVCLPDTMDPRGPKGGQR
jgi:hypothetical protein